MALIIGHCNCVSGSSTLTTQALDKDLTNAANIFRTQASNFKTQYTNFLNYGKELDTYWQGDAKDTFNAQIQKDQGEFAKMHKAVIDLATALDEEAKAYAANEAAAVNTVKSR